MKNISKRDADRILAHIQKAISIYEQQEMKSDDGRIAMNDEQIDAITDALHALEYYVNNTVWN